MTEKRAVQIGIPVGVTILFYKLTITDIVERIVSRLFFNSGIVIYILGLCVFGITTLLVTYNEKVYSFCARNLITIVLSEFFLFLINDMYEKEKTFTNESLEKAYYQINKYLLCAIVLVAALIMIGLINVELSKIKGIALTFAALISIIFTLTAFYTPSLMMNDYQRVHNGEVFTQIYNLCMEEPYGRTQYGIYGHYGIFYYFVFKIIGLEINSFIILQMCLGGVAIILSVYVIYRRVNNTIIAVCSCFLLCILWGANFSYSTVTYQALVREWPLIVMDAFVVLVGKRGLLKNKRRTYAVLAGYFISALNIIWNTEMGIVSAITWAFTCVLINKDRSENIVKNKVVIFAKGSMINVAGICASFMGAFLLANVFNVCVMQGHLFSISTFLIPFISSSPFMTESLVLPLAGGNVPWIWVLLMGVVVLSPSISNAFTDASNDEYVVDGAIAVTMLGGMVYFVNRPAIGCLYVVAIQGAILLGILFDRIIEARNCIRYAVDYGHENRVKENIMKSVVFFIAIIMSGLLVITVLRIYEVRSNNAVLDYSAEDLLSVIRDSITRDTPAVGLGTSIIYASLGWDTGYHLADEVFHTREAVDKFEQALLDGSSKIVCKYNIDVYNNGSYWDYDMWTILNEKYSIRELGSLSDVSVYLYLSERKQ